jgi:hypothetical protein
MIRHQTLHPQCRGVGLRYIKYLFSRSQKTDGIRFSFFVTFHNIFLFIQNYNQLIHFIDQNNTFLAFNNNKGAGHIALRSMFRT